MLLEIEALQKQFKAAFDQGVLNGDLTEAENLKREIENKTQAIKQSLDEARIPYPAYEIEVDYGQSVEKLTKMGQYDYVNREVNSRLFPSKEVGQKKINLYLLNFDNIVSANQVLIEMSQKKLRPATLKELLTLGAKYPELQLEATIVALGSEAKTYDTMSCAYLFYDEISHTRGVGVYGVQGDWISGWHFAAVKV